ncbi:3-deoxy-7-phosphoheptulonate synthase [Geotoga petraea]|uniref:3-deoxy-D-arabinoheptulosonate-7-phosphate synthase n=1 Tax=Geotoga petraea TaxID=28234 RepID=A0A1G6LX28_9BACT|nr:3-deoxy-7-phosphoheptulonate synthase [Geotoga petraea]SDC47285.1 3-deoxy-D-arabinoheptulosonate-7-phosphate synthase [Geotoga petraea]
MFEKFPKLSSIDEKKISIKGKDYFIDDFEIIAGPCSIEDEQVMDEICSFLKDNDIKILRGGAFKPRTSPYSFQGGGITSLEIMKKYSEKYDLITLTEALGFDSFEIVRDITDIIQIGSRNSQNFELLKLVGKQKKPVLLKRGFMNTIEEFLFSAEYIASEGNKNIILCERGIRTFEPSTRNTLDLNSIVMISQNLKVPIVSDPSHAAGRRDLIEKLSYSSFWAGADGIMLEIHPNPEKAISDGQQTIDFKTLEKIIKKIKGFEEQNV